MLWERATGEPLGPLLSWQDQRTAADCARLRDDGRRRAGPRASAACRSTRCSPRSRRAGCSTRTTRTARRSRARRAVPRHGRLLAAQPLRRRARHRGRQRLAHAAARRAHRRLGRRAARAVRRPARRCCRAVVPSTGPVPRGPRPARRCRDGVPVAAVLGDSHAALFAHAGWRPGQVKATYGTGSSVMSARPSRQPTPPTALCLTVAWDDGEPALRARGQHPRPAARRSRWLAELLGTTPGRAGRPAAAPAATACTWCPAFGGLGAPWWDDEAVGLISGLTLRHRPAAARARRARVDRVPGRGRGRGRRARDSARSTRCSPTAGRPATRR